MPGKYRVPVIVGVGEIKNPSRSRDDAIEPLQLMLRAIHQAAQDALGPQEEDLIRDINGVSVVASSTWPYVDLPGLVSQGLNINPKHTVYSPLAGSSSVQLIDDTARLIAKGDIEVGVAVGGEAFASLKEYIKTGTYPPPWVGPGTDLDNVYYANNVDKYYAHNGDMLDGIAKVHNVGVPMQIYAMYENGLRAHRGQTIEENHRESAALYGKYAQVAARNPMAWNFGRDPETEKSIATVGSRNRMICFPYPLLMNAFNDVNLAAACILTSSEYAEKMGIPPSKWIFPLGGGRANDSEHFWERDNFHSSPAISNALDMGLCSSGLSKEDIDVFDFYSCFPIVPKLACLHLGIPINDPPKPITLGGGLTSFGGAGANYSMHAVAAMVRTLREQRSTTSRISNGLVLANGGVLTNENVICLSTHPRRVEGRYPRDDTLPAGAVIATSPSVVESGSGQAVIETYTVEFDRENNPKLGHIVCRLTADGSRVVANHGDLLTLKRLSSRTEEPVGQLGVVQPSTTRPGQNLFTLLPSSRL